MIKAICTQFRNESNKISQWIKYNINEGFNTFILFDDGSSDNSEKIVRDTINFYGKNVFLYYFQTKKEDNAQLYENCLDTDKYQSDSSLHRRISQSFLRGFEIFKSLSNVNEINYCCFIDIDEVLISNKQESITKIIENNFAEKKVNHLYVQSYDVNTISLKTDEDVFYDESTKYRWSEKNRVEFLDGKYSHRGKSIVTNMHRFLCSSEDFWSIIHCGGCLGRDFKTAVPVETNKIPDISELRIHHYRVPPNDNSIIFDEYDDFAFGRLQKIK